MFATSGLHRDRNVLDVLRPALRSTVTSRESVGGPFARCPHYRRDNAADVPNAAPPRMAAIAYESSSSLLFPSLMILCMPSIRRSLRRIRFNPARKTCQCPEFIAVPPANSQPRRMPRSPQAACRFQDVSAAFSAIMIVGAFRFPVVMDGMMESRPPSIPRRRAPSFPDRPRQRVAVSAICRSTTDGRRSRPSPG